LRDNGGKWLAGLYTGGCNVHATHIQAGELDEAVENEKMDNNRFNGHIICLYGVESRAFLGNYAKDKKEKWCGVISIHNSPIH
jgi:hypothetical protein